MPGDNSFLNAHRFMAGLVALVAIGAVLALLFAAPFVWFWFNWHCH